MERKLEARVEQLEEKLEIAKEALEKIYVSGISFCCEYGRMLHTERVYEIGIIIEDSLQKIKEA